MRTQRNQFSDKTQKLHNARLVQSRSGQSIIEVLVAIALLVFGVFAVLRVFPIGFNMLRQTGLQQQVQQLADSLAQEARNGQTQAPDGIVQRVYVTGSSNTPGWQIPNGTTPAAVGTPVPPGTLRQNDYRQNSLFTQRTILGERFTVKANSAASLLLFGPLSFDPAIPTDVDGNVQVYDPNGYTDVTNSGANPGQRQFAVSAGNILTIGYSDPDYNKARHYLLSYRTTQGNAAVDVVDEDVIIPAALLPGDVSSAAGFAQGAPIPGTIKLYRRFMSGNGTNGTFQLIDPTSLPHYLGVIQIGPYAGIGGWVIAPGATLAADYTTRDWQILRLEQDVPNDLTIHLPINNLDILDRSVDPTVRVIAVNMNDPTKASQISAITFPGGAPTPGSVNVRDGIVYLDPAVWSPGTAVRIYYAAYSTWAQQPLVSFSTYTQVAPGPAGYRYFYQDTPVQTPNTTTWTSKLHFSITDIGKSVSMDYSYLDWNNAGHTKTAQTFRIQADAPVNPADAFINVIYDVPGTPSNANAVPILIPARVQGISFQARGVFLQTGDVRRADDPLLPNDNQIWNPSQIGRLGEASEDVYVPRQ